MSHRPLSLPPSLKTPSLAQSAEAFHLTRAARNFVTKWSEPEGRPPRELSDDYRAVVAERDRLPPDIKRLLNPDFWSALEVARGDAIRALIPSVGEAGLPLLE